MRQKGHMSLQLHGYGWHLPADPTRCGRIKSMSRYQVRCHARGGAGQLGLWEDTAMAMNVEPGDYQGYLDMSHGLSDV